MISPTIGFAGMTHLGLISAAAAANHRFQVVAYDPDVALIDQIRRADYPIVEPSLPELIKSRRDGLIFTADDADLYRCDVIYIAVDVPTDDHGNSDLLPISNMIERIRGARRSGSTIVILSQVPPGFTRNLPIPDDELYYQVETLIFGRAIERASKPTRFIIGCLNPARSLPPALTTFLNLFSCPILPMRYESAELAKISINFCLVASISVANTLAEISEEIGADWAEIMPALKLDERIGPHAYLKPGLGIAGGNLERDLRTILSIAEHKKLEAGIVKAWLENSAHRKTWPWRVLRDHVLPGKNDAKIAVLGLAYKENTHSTKNSPALALLAHLKGQTVSVHDPVVPASIVPWAVAAADPYSAAKGADAVVIATPWPQYRGLDPAELMKAMRGRVIVDPYRVLNALDCSAAGFTYYALGMPALAGQ